MPRRREINDRKSPMAETDPATRVEPLTGIIWPAMSLRIAEPNELGGVNRRCPAMMNDARDATHAMGK